MTENGAQIFLRIALGIMERVAEGLSCTEVSGSCLGAEVAVAEIHWLERAGMAPGCF